MATSIFESQILGALFPVGDIGHLFTDRAELRALLIVEGALANAQGTLGLIPSQSAERIHKASLEVQFDPFQLRDGATQNGVCVPSLITLFRESLPDPEDRDFVHFGATSQDIIDTALMLRMKQVLLKQEECLKSLLSHLGDMAQRHATLACVARTYAQNAAPTSFGAIVAQWGMPLVRLLEELKEVRENVLFVSLSGAVGTSAALGEQSDELRQEFAKSLGLNVPPAGWHTERAPLSALISWQMSLCAALGKIATDVMDFAHSGRALVSLGKSGASSTLPQKKNPVQPNAILATIRYAQSVQGCLLQSQIHGDARDGVSWFTEWIALPQMILASSSALINARDMIEGLTPDKTAIAREVASSKGLIYAEALTFQLASDMGRVAASEAIKSLCAEVAANDERSLLEEAQKRFPALSTYDPQTALGDAPERALAFARHVKDSLP